MKDTWASGAIELLRHADSHIHLATAFDQRIAFISIDNCVETSIRTFLALPKSKSGIHVPRKDLEAVENSFPGLLSLLWTHAASRLSGIDDADIEHYHRIRNKLYHDGTGLSVDVAYLQAYRQIAVLLLKNLFAIEMGEPRPAPSLERLIFLWNQVEGLVRKKMLEAGVDLGHTFKWETAMKAGVLSTEDIHSLTELRTIRNQQVHSTTLAPEKVSYAVGIAERLLAKFLR